MIDTLAKTNIKQDSVPRIIGIRVIVEVLRIIGIIVIVEVPRIIGIIVIVVVVKIVGWLQFYFELK